MLTRAYATLLCLNVLWLNGSSYQKSIGLPVCLTATLWYQVRPPTTDIPQTGVLTTLKYLIANY